MRFHRLPESSIGSGEGERGPPVGLGRVPRARAVEQPPGEERVGGAQVPEHVATGGRVPRHHRARHQATGEPEVRRGAREV